MQYTEKEYVDLIYSFIMEKTLILRFILILGSAVFFLTGIVMILFYDIIIGTGLSVIVLFLTIAVLTVFYVFFAKTAIIRRKEICGFNIYIQNNVIKTSTIYNSGEKKESYEISHISKIVKHKKFAEIVCDNHRRIIVKNDKEFWDNIGNFLIENLVEVKDHE